MTTGVTENRSGPRPDEREGLRRRVSEVVGAAPVIDMHTHLFAPEFGELGLSGIDELLTYHYLVAETFRSAEVTYEDFWRMSKAEQADLVWRTLFVENTPVSEAARGVVTVLDAFGLDTTAEDLREAREFFRGWEPAAHLGRVLELAGVSDVVMTNDPFDERETQVWESGVGIDGRFHAALRMDGLLNDWGGAADALAARGYGVDKGLSGESARKFRNLLPFGCWWFLNNPSIIKEITLERVELLGTSFVAQHSDARILEQLVYKWRHSRRVISEVLAEAYGRLLESGRGVTRAEIERDVARMFSGNFRAWVGLAS